MMQSQADDEVHMRRCVTLAALAARQGDYPFGSLISLNGIIVSEGHNEAKSQSEVCRHAEMLALIGAQKRLSPAELSSSWVYTSVEPCPMCSFAIRELKIQRVIFGLRSPIMGGYSKYGILQDTKLNLVLPYVFGPVPEIVPDVLKDEVIAGWAAWDAETWKSFLSEGLFIV